MLRGPESLVATVQEDNHPFILNECRLIHPVAICANQADPGGRSKRHLAWRFCNL